MASKEKSSVERSSAQVLAFPQQDTASKTMRVADLPFQKDEDDGDGTSELRRDGGYYVDFDDEKAYEVNQRLREGERKIGAKAKRDLRVPLTEGGSCQRAVKSHPLFTNKPEGASLNLSTHAQSNPDVAQEIRRQPENQPAPSPQAQAQLTAGLSHTTTPSLSR